MAFDAGAIEATLTLNRNPFTAGLAAAKAQVDQWKKRVNPVEIDVKINLKQRELMELEALLKRVGRQRVQATARVLVDRLQFDKLLKDLRTFDRKVYSTRLDVDAGKATVEVIAFRKLLDTLNDKTVNLSANTRSFGRAAGDGFGEGTSHFSKMASLIIAALPVIASLFTATVGAVGALASAFVIAGLGAGAFALVAVPVFKQVKNAVADGQAAIDKLPDGLRQAANGLKELLGEYDKLVKANQKIVAISLSAWFNAGTAALKTLNPLIQASANAFGDAGLKAIAFFNSPWWGGFVQFLSRSVGPAVEMLTSSIFALIKIVGNLTRAFWDLGGGQIMAMITFGLEKFALYTERIGENRTFQQFMDAAVRSLPEVGRLIGALVEFIFKLAIGLEPLGTLIIRVLTGIFDAINSMPIPVVQSLAIAIAGVWAAVALGATGPVGLAIGILAGLAAYFVHAATTGDSLRQSIEGLIAPIRDWFNPLARDLGEIWETVVIPAWNKAVAATRENLIPVFEYLWKMFQDNVLPALSRLALTFTGTLLPAILNFWTAIQPFVAFVVKAFGEDIIYAIQLMVSTFDGGFKMVAGLLDIFTGIFTGDWGEFTSGIQTMTEGFWTIIAGIFGLNFDQLKARMQQWDAEIDAMWHSFWDGLTGWFKGLWEGIRQWWTGFLQILSGDTSAGADNIGQAWRKIANLFRDPINWVINTVINDGIIGAWNQVMGWIGVGGISGRVPNLPAFAQGGPIRGGVAGRDSVPILTMPGEYVLSKPAVDNLGGPAAVEGMHQAARAGVGLPGFAGGGLIGNAISTVVSWWSQLSGQVTSLFNGLNFGHSPMGGSIGDAISGIPSKLVEKVLDAARRKLEALTTTIVTFVTGGLGAAAQAVGLGGGGARAWIIAHESGGNPTAQNPTSTASGLYQMINGTWKAYGGSTPTAKQASVAEQNAVADRYVAARYGSWENAQAFWQSHGYYDAGGILPPGTTVAHNLSGKPEAILTMNQLHSLTSNRGLTAQDVSSIVNAALTRQGGDVYNVMLPERASVRELADSLDFKRRVVSKGRYR